MSTDSRELPVIVCGGGIGGLAAALALPRRGLRATVLEQAEHIGEIGAGIQLGPNAFAAFDALGVGERARARAVFTDRMVMMDAVDGSEVASVPVGEAFRKRFGNPYAVIHRADGRDEVVPSKQVTTLKRGDRVTVETAGGGGYGDPKRRDAALVKADIANGKVSAKAAREIYGQA